MNWTLPTSLSVIFTVPLVLYAHRFWTDLRETTAGARLPRFIPWLCKGWAAPSILWLAINAGWFLGLPPLLIESEQARAAGASWHESAFLALPSWFLVTALWGNVTFAWCIAAIAADTESASECAAELRILAVFWGLIALLLAIPLTAVFGALGWILVVLAWLAPWAHSVGALATRRTAKPFYARAIALMKFGKFRDAEDQVLRELEKSEDDFEGWMMLAELYAAEFGELAEADKTVRAICAQPNATRLQISTALNRLADWHLRLGQDIASARRALEEIERTIPDSHFARMARQRLSRLPRNREEFEESRQPKVFRLPPLSDELDEAPQPPAGPEEQRAAAERARRCVDKLREDPNQLDPRETLATLLAERLGQPAEAVEQLELLLALPDVEPRRRAEWLSRVAAWQIKLLGRPDAGRETLRALIRDHGDTPQAFAAQRRLNLLEMEGRLRQRLDPRKSGNRLGLRSQGLGST